MAVSSESKAVFTVKLGYLIDNDAAAHSVDSDII